MSWRSTSDVFDTVYRNSLAPTTQEELSLNICQHQPFHLLPALVAGPLPGRCGSRAPQILNRKDQPPGEGVLLLRRLQARDYAANVSSRYWSRIANPYRKKGRRHMSRTLGVLVLILGVGDEVEGLPILGEGPDSVQIVALVRHVIG